MISLLARETFDKGAALQPYFEQEADVLHALSKTNVFQYNIGIIGEKLQESQAYNEQAN